MMLKTKHSLLMSTVSLLLCFSMLLGTTFAWFTDSVTSSNNIIKSGTLKVSLEWMEGNLDPSSKDSSEWKNAASGTLFSSELWEPGYTEVKHIKIENEGSLALKYILDIIPYDEYGNTLSADSLEKDGVNLAKAIDVYYLDPAEIVDERADLTGKTPMGTLYDVIKSLSSTANGSLLNKGDSKTITLALKMQEKAGNEYQDKSIGASFAIRLMATQFTKESDSIDNKYDTDSKWPFENFNPEVETDSATADVTSIDNKIAGSDVSLTSTSGKISATLPEGTLLNDNTTAVTLKISEVDESKANITLSENEASLSVDVHIDGVSKNNDAVIKVDIEELLPIGLNMGNYRFYHVENGTTTEMTLLENGVAPIHNNYEYDPATGNVTLYLKSFSEITVAADTDNAWNGVIATGFASGTGTEADPYIIANADQLAAFGAIVGGMNDQTQDSFAGKTVNLIADINLGDKESKNNPNLIFYPIGYYNSNGSYEKTSGGSVTSSVSRFEGTFDGKGHTISNFYQNTWEMFGDYNDGYSGTPNHYKDAMGLFGYVHNGTVKNLTVDNFSSDGEFTPTGVIAAYADGNSSFENIAITNSNPRVYNTGNGGIIGIAGDTSAANDDHITLKNITVDNSNKISALWGSYDVACGGLVGMYRGNVDGSGNATGDTISFENCHVSAIIDVYNDVCANYQYYAYRYSGMIIGSVRHNTKNAEGKTIPNMAGIEAENCTVNYGDWNDYYYCEFEKNTMASYSEDYQFSRVPHSELNFTDSNGNGVVDADERASVIGCKHTHTAEENHQAIYLPFHQLFTGYSWGVSSIGLEKYGGIVTNLNITEGDQEKSDEKFESNVTELANNKVYKLGDIFNVVENDVDIVAASVTVTVTNLDENNPVTAKFNRDDENWENSTITFNGAGEVTLTIQDYYFCTPTTITVNITNRQPEEKFDIVMNNGDFLHRVGNSGTVALDKLFKAKDDVNVGNASVTIEAVNGTGASGTYSNNAIQFSGTGVVKVTITDNDYCIPTVLYLEVVDAVNATGATSATKNNVVLLQNCGFSSLEISGGYTLYGNGFTMTCSSDSVAIDRTYSFVELKGGTLDNVKVVAPNFSHAVMYEKNKTENGNPYSTDSSGRTRYNNIRSAVLVSDDSKITNSYISGGRAAVYATSGTLSIENSTIHGGAVANIQAEASSQLILEDVTLIQKPIKANVNDTSKTLMGFSVVMMCDTTGIGAPVTLKGYLHQYAWANSDYKSYVPKDGQDVVDDVLGQTDFIHSITYLDGKTRDSVNLGFAYMPDGTTATNAENLKDERFNKAKIPYDSTKVSVVAAIYTYKNTKGTDDSVKSEPEYNATVQGITLPIVSYEDVNENRVFTTSYDSTKDWWKSTLKVDVDAGVYDFNFNKLKVQKNGKDLTYTVTAEDGTVVSKDANIELNSSVSNIYTLTITDDQIYDKDGNVTGEKVEYTYKFELLATKTSLPAPTWISDTLNGTPYIVVDSKGSDWNCAVPVLDGLRVKYWSKKQSKEVELDLANVVSAAGLSAGLQNGANNTITITVADEYTLQITTTGFKTNDNGKPVVVNDKLYFTVSSSSNYVSTKTTDRTPNISYVFTDANNSDSINLSTSFNVVYATYKATQYKYNDFCNGELTAATSGGGCVTPDTLVTLADGTQKRIDEVTYSDKLLVWNFYEGKYDIASAAIIFDHGADNNTVIRLTFSDGTTVKIVNMHQFFDADLNKFVTITGDSVSEYLGHNFVKHNASGNTFVELVDYAISNEYIEAWGIMSAEHYNIIVEDMLSADFNLKDVELFNYFDVGSDLKYNEAKMQSDIEKYGLYEYADFADYLTYEQFDAFNVKYFKIPVSKGQYTYEGILELIEQYLN